MNATITSHAPLPRARKSIATLGVVRNTEEPTYHRWRVNAGAGITATFGTRDQAREAWKNARRYGQAFLCTDDDLTRKVAPEQVRSITYITAPDERALFTTPDELAAFMAQWAHNLRATFPNATFISRNGDDNTIITHVAIGQHHVGIRWGFERAIFHAMPTSPNGTSYHERNEQ
jgi:hypothetical protein